jgi:adenine-specific DNA-methyltransferase
MENYLLQADNLIGLHYLIYNLRLRGKVDLVYIDPPYATNTEFRISKNRKATISSLKDGEVAFTDRLKGQDYLNFLEERLILIRELLSDEGSLYIHVDYKIGHYVKVLADSIFGIENFRSDITRIKCNPKNFSRIGYGNIKDMILFYTKGNNPIWNEPYEDYTEEDADRLFKRIDEKGRRYTTVPLHAPGETIDGDTGRKFRGLYPPPGRHWRADIETLDFWDGEGLIEWSSTGNPRKRIYLEDQLGKRVQDIWEFKDPQTTLYPTEKNSDLLERIVSVSSRPGSLVLDCFSGSGTTMLASEKLGRRWIGIDESTHAISATFQKFRQYLKENPNESIAFRYIGIPSNFNIDSDLSGINFLIKNQYIQQELNF